MAAAAKKIQQTPTADPKFEWAEKAGSYVLRLELPGFRKEDFRVQIDGTGRLTVRGTRTGATGPGSLCKVFQLPSAASLDDIAGRFEAGVLTLTVSKRAVDAGVAKEEENKVAGSDMKKSEAKEETGEENVFNKSVDEATNKTQQNKQEEEASRCKKEQEKPTPTPTPAKKEEDVKPKAAAAAPPSKPAPKPEADTRTDKAKAAIAPEGLAEKVRRRGEEENANASTMGAAKRAKIDGEKKATVACGGWKERMAVDLKVLTDMKWADRVVDAARKNKEAVAVGIAAFSLGFLVSQKLFKK